MYFNSLRVYSDPDFSKSVIFHEQAKNIIFCMKDLELLYPAYNAPLRACPFSESIPWMTYETGKELTGKVLEFEEGYGSEYEIDDLICNLSTKEPSLIFELETHEDVYDDYYKQYFHNGKVKYCPGSVTIEYLPFESADWKQFTND